MITRDMLYDEILDAFATDDYHDPHYATFVKKIELYNETIVPAHQAKLQLQIDFAQTLDRYDDYEEREKTIAASITKDRIRNA